MLHKIETEEVNGKTFVKRILFDIGDAVDSFYQSLVGYDSKTISQLIEEEQIMVYMSDNPVDGAEVLEFKRPISLDRFLIMFGNVPAETDLESLSKVDKDEGFYDGIDQEKYVI